MNNTVNHSAMAHSPLLIVIVIIIIIIFNFTLDFALLHPVVPVACVPAAGILRMYLLARWLAITRYMFLLCFRHIGMALGTYRA